MAHGSTEINRCSKKTTTTKFVRGLMITQAARINSPQSASKPAHKTKTPCSIPNKQGGFQTLTIPDASECLDSDQFKPGNCIRRIVAQVNLTINRQTMFRFYSGRNSTSGPWTGTPFTSTSIFGQFSIGVRTSNPFSPIRIVSADMA